MSVTHDIAAAEHVPSEPPDPKALFSRLAAFSAGIAGASSRCGCWLRSRPRRSR